MDQPQKKHPPLLTRLQNAWHGLTFFFLEDYKITVPVLIVVGVLGWLADPTPTELLIVVLAVGVGVLVGTVNTIVEELCDLYSTDYNPKIQRIKDMAAGACLFYILIAIVLFILIVN